MYLLKNNLIIEFDGLTIVLTATQSLPPGDYDFKIGVGDGIDGVSWILFQTLDHM